MDSFHHYRFYIPALSDQLPPGRTTVLLADDQSHHARTVLRLSGGEPVILFDGRGAWIAGHIAGSVDKRRPVAVEVASPLTVDPPPAPRLTLATAIPKGERADWLVEQASQLNVSRISWLTCDRSVVKPREGSAKVEKFRRLAIESAKQCHRTHLLHIDDPVDVNALLKANPSSTLLWLDPRAPQSLPQLLPALSSTDILALVGPEGGWSDGENALLSSHSQIQPIRLTPTVLRIETAAAAVAAILMSR
jgi:16S rRNA (uracil1498-N3)-methyltransferase